MLRLHKIVNPDNVGVNFDIEMNNLYLESQQKVPSIQTWANFQNMVFLP